MRAWQQSADRSVQLKTTDLTGNAELTDTFFDLVVDLTHASVGNLVDDTLPDHWKKPLTHIGIERSAEGSHFLGAELVQTLDRDQDTLLDTVLMRPMLVFAQWTRRSRVCWIFVVGVTVVHTMQLEAHQ